MKLFTVVFMAVVMVASLGSFCHAYILPADTVIWRWSQSEAEAIRQLEQLLLTHGRLNPGYPSAHPGAAQEFIQSLKDQGRDSVLNHGSVTGREWNDYYNKVLLQRQQAAAAEAAAAPAATAGHDYPGTATGSSEGHSSGWGSNFALEEWEAALSRPKPEEKRKWFDRRPTRFW